MIGFAAGDTIQSLVANARAGIPVSFANAAPASGGGSAGYNPSSYTISPSLGSSNPDSANAQLTRSQYQYFLNRNKPYEDQALAGINDPATSRNLAATAGANAGAMIDQTQGMEERNLSRFGVPITADKQRSLGRNFGMARALGVTAASNTAFGGAEDANTDLAGDALGIGRELTGQASRGLSSAASLQQARQQARDAGNSANRQGVISSVGTGAGLGAALGIGGSLAGIGITTGLGGGILGGGIGLLTAFL